MSSAAHPRVAQSIDDWRDRGVLKPYVTERRIAGTPGVHMVEVGQPGGRFEFLALPDLQIATTRSPDAATVDVGVGAFRAEFGIGDFVVGVPDQAPVAIFDAPFVLRGFVFPRRLVRSTLPAWTDGAPFGTLHAGVFRDPLIAGLLDRLWRAGASRHPVNSLVADTAAAAVLALLAEAAIAAPGRAVAFLRARQLADIEAAVNSRLADDLSLADLAGFVGLSPFHFARAFQRHVGIPPHDWLRRRRIERAKALLRETDLDLVHVALAVGYGSQSAFGSVFRRLTGTTPQKWRETHRRSSPG